MEKKKEAMFKIHSNFKPSGDQPQAIEKLVKGIKNGVKEQILLGATDTDKTFTIANVIKDENQLQRCENL